MHVQLFNAFLCTSLTKIASLWSSAVPLVRIAASAQGLLELRSEINTIVEQHQKKINEWLYFKLCGSKLKKSRDFHGIHGVQRPCCFSFEQFEEFAHFTSLSSSARGAQDHPKTKARTLR